MKKISQFIYLCGAAAFNHNVKVQYEQFELQLPGILPTDEKWIATSQEQLTQAVRKDVGDIAEHVLILFDTHFDRLLSVRAVRLTPSLDISFEENWTDFIHDPYDAEQVVDPGTLSKRHVEDNILVFPQHST